MSSKGIPTDSPLRQIHFLSEEAKLHASVGDFDTMLALFKRVMQGIESNRGRVDGIYNLERKCLRNWSMAVDMLETTAKRLEEEFKKDQKKHKRALRELTKSGGEDKRIGAYEAMLRHDAVAGHLSARLIEDISFAVETFRSCKGKLTLNDVEFYQEMFVELRVLKIV